MSWVATAIAGSALLGAGASIYGANKASQTQMGAAGQATQAQLAMFGQGAGAVQGAQQTLQPFATLGGQTMQQLQAQLPDLTAKFNPTMSQLEQTPGYQFTLDQGLKATTNADAAMGLGNSGVQGKGIANYAEGLASTTYQQQFQNYLQQQQQRYSMLMGPTQLGAQAAGGILGGAESLLGGSINTGQGIGGNIMGGANASAAATMTSANAVGGLGSNALNSYMQYMLMSKLGMGGFGGINNANPFALSNTADLGGAGVGSGNYNMLDAQVA